MNQSGREAIMNIQTIEEKIERLLVIMNDQADLYFSEATPEPLALKYGYDNAVKRHFTCYEILSEIDESLCDAIESLLEVTKKERLSKALDEANAVSYLSGGSERALNAV